MSDFKEFLNSFSNEELIQMSSKYFPDKSYTDNSEKIVNVNLAIAKGLLRKYHEWLINNFDISPKK